jgi:aryl-alcohol dehydrogenase-like predicted oxidoreductase
VDTWRYRTTSALPQKRLFRLGLAANYGIDEAGVRYGMDRGINFFFVTLFRDENLRGPLREALRGRRDEVAVAGVASPGWFGWNVRRSAERTLKDLKIDTLDLMLLGWLGVGSAWTAATERELLHLKESGKVKAIGVSIHDRPRAGKLAESSPLDLLMIRYNAAHPGAERDIFPHRRQDAPSILAYTATAWRRLLKKPGSWTGPAMTPGDCYRFQLSSPHVDLALTGPSSRQELKENLDALDRGPLSPEEDRWMRDFGRAVHG